MISIWHSLKKVLQKAHDLKLSHYHDKDSQDTKLKSMYEPTIMENWPQ